MEEKAINNVLMGYVIENANLKIANEEYKQLVASLEKQLEEATNSGVSEK